MSGDCGPFVPSPSGASGAGGSAAIRSIAGGTTLATGPLVSFVNANNVSFGINGNTVTASVVPDAGIGLAVPGTTIATGTAVLSNSNGVSFGINGSTVTASVAAGATATGNLGAIAAGTQTATSGTVALADSNGVSFGMSGSSQVTGIVASVIATGTQLALVSAASNVSMTAGAFMVVSASALFLGGTGVNIAATGNVDATAGSNISLRAASSVSVSAGSAVLLGAGANGSVRVGASNNTVGFFGQAGTGRQTITGTNATALNNLFGALASYGLISNAATISGFASGNLGAIVAAGGTATSGTVSFIDSNGASFGFVGAQSLRVNYAAPRAVSAGTQSGASSGTLSFADSNGVSFGLNGNTITASVDAGGLPVVSALNNNLVGVALNTASFGRTNSFYGLVNRTLIPALMSMTQLRAGFAILDAGGTATVTAVIYTMTRSTANSLASGTRSFSYDGGTPVDLTVGLNATVTGGDYLVGLWGSGVDGGAGSNMIRVYGAALGDNVSTAYGFQDGSISRTVPNGTSQTASFVLSNYVNGSAASRVNLSMFGTF